MTKYYKKDRHVTTSEEPIEGYQEITEKEYNDFLNTCKELAELHDNLKRSDYVVIKIAEGVATSEEYAEVLANRATWRARINELESQLN